MNKVSRVSALAAALCIGSATAQAQRINVQVNNNPVSFRDTQPQEVGGRVMVPLRGVLEQMGAFVEWNPVTRTVMATRGSTNIQLPLGSRIATVDGRSVTLDVPAMSISGRTMVPLRFVGESLGAYVTWLPASRTVAISTDGQPIASAFPAQPRAYRNQNRAFRRNAALLTLNSGTVIPAELDQPLSSKANRSGDRFSATVRSGEDDAGLPAGTKIHGVVRAVTPASGGNPGVLDVDFNRITMPDGQTKAMSGQLISLDGRTVERDSSGRLVAKDRRNADRLKWVGIGAGAGAILGVLTKGNTITNVLLGAGLGYLYNELANQRVGDVELGAGTDFGVMLDQSLSVRARNLD